MLLARDWRRGEHAATVRGGHSSVKGRERVGKRLRADVVEIRQGAFPGRIRRVLIAGKRTPRVAGNRPMDPLPLGRIHPAVTQLDQPWASRATAKEPPLSCEPW